MTKSHYSGRKKKQFDIHVTSANRTTVTSFYSESKASGFMKSMVDKGFAVKRKVKRIDLGKKYQADKSIRKGKRKSKTRSMKL